MHPITERLLVNRGIVEPKAQEEFLAPDYGRDVRDPYEILGMERAVERIITAIDAKEKIVVFGDYDCDGIPGSVVLHDFFAKIDHTRVEYYIPHRHHEGFGLSEEAVERFILNDVSLIITVDCGIADVAAVARANGSGVDVIVTDHHLPGPVLPDAFVILNSKQAGDAYHDDMLCGAGVAYKLVQALVRSGHFDIPTGWEKWLLDMVGVSTIADLVPLVKENRALAYFGLKVLRRSPRPGLRALLAEAAVDQRFLTEDDVGFTIAPRINAASRMAEPILAFHMLATKDEKKAITCARELENLNISRKTLTKTIAAQAHEQVAARKVRRPIIVVGDERWTLGVVGIVAAQLVERYKCPAFVWCREGGEVRGSCRSDGSADLAALMHAVPGDLFIARGGHALAGGFSVVLGREGELEKALNIAFAKLGKREVPETSYDVDCDLQLRDVNGITFSAISALAPFGIGNPKPVFAFRGVRLLSVAQFGKTKEHLKLVVGDETGVRSEAIAWFKTAADYPRAHVAPGISVTLLAHIEESRFMGRVSLRLKIVDMVEK